MDNQKFRDAKERAEIALQNLKPFEGYVEVYDPATGVRYSVKSDQMTLQTLEVTSEPTTKDIGTT